MPEGPSIVLAREAVEPFKGRKVLQVEGNTSIDKERLLNRKILDFKSWGKHFLVCFKDFTLRIHFMMFGSYTVNERKDQAVRLRLVFSNGELNLYNCSLKILEGDIDSLYNWSADVLNDSWDPAAALRKLEEKPQMMVCDALLNQDIFAGVGNIIKNEVLFRVLVHPASTAGKIPVDKLKEIVKEARNYSFDFLEWKRNYVLRKHWLVHTMTQCPRCGSRIIKEYMGKTNRRTFFCAHCQIKYE